MPFTDGFGLPVKITITPGQAHDLTAAEDLLDCIADGDMLLADKAYDADWLRAATRTRGAWANSRQNLVATALSVLALGFTKGVT
jgi:transposase